MEDKADKVTGLIYGILQGGILVGALSAFIFYMGYEYELGVYAGFGIGTAHGFVDPSIYVDLLGHASIARRYAYHERTGTSPYETPAVVPYTEQI